MSDAPNINRSTERTFGGIGGGLPLLSLPVLIAAAIWASRRAASPVPSSGRS
jgi:hypothetical protein